MHEELVGLNPEGMVDKAIFKAPWSIKLTSSGYATRSL